MRRLMVLIFLGILLSGCDDAYDKSKKKSVAALEDFFDEIEHEEVIIDSNDVDEIMDALDEQLGDYFTGDFYRKTEYEMKQFINSQHDFEQDPRSISFFLTNGGDGLRFSKADNVSHRSWQTIDDEIVGTTLSVRLDREPPGWKEMRQGMASVEMFELDGEWKIDDYSYYTGEDDD